MIIMNIPADAPVESEPVKRSVLALGRVRRGSVAIPLFLLLLSAIVYPLWWKSAPIMGRDSEEYQAVAKDLIDHGSLTQMHFRCPGYPLLLVLTGSSETPTRMLFLITFGLYLASVFMLISILRHLELPGWCGVVLCLICITPPFVEPSAYVMTEGLTTFLLVGAIWRLVVHADVRSSSIVAGILTGLAALTRPTYQLLGLALAGLLLCLHETKKAIRVALASILIVGGFACYNWIKFDCFAITPALGWNLSTRTARFVDRMPNGPMRDLLVTKRNEELIEGESHSSEEYVYRLKREMGKATGLDAVGQGKYLLSLNRNLILNSPLHYLEAVGNAGIAYWFPAYGTISNCDSKSLQLLWTLAHFVLIAAFFVQLVAIVGTALTNGLPDATRRLTYPYAMGLLVIFYTMTLSCLIDVGNPRFRVPADGVIVLVTLLGIEMWKRIRSEQTIIRLRQRRERALGPPRGSPAHQFN